MVHFYRLILSVLSITIFVKYANAGGIVSIDQSIQSAAPTSTDLSLMQDDSSILVELDMRFSPEQWSAIQEIGHVRLSDMSRPKRNALKEVQKRWTNATVPYYYVEGFSVHDKEVIQSAMQEWEKMSCVKFRAAEVRDKARIKIIPQGGCSSNVGMLKSEEQTVTLGPNCIVKGIIAHELGHTLGFHHEQTRPDRDQFIKIYQENILAGMEFNFEKYTWAILESFGVGYDYKSIMHYGPYSFSKNGQPTVKTLDPKYQSVIGNRYGVSYFDVKLVNAMYGCGKRCPATVKCTGESFIGKDCKCWCEGPSNENPVIYCDTKKPVGVVAQGNVPTAKPTPKPADAAVPNKTIDQNQHCAYWAKIGECKKNPAYMLMNCKQSCAKVTQTITTSEKCVDVEKPWKCKYLALNGGCTNTLYKEYMLKNCKRACGKCT